jgi:hypothetical protein
MIDVAYHHIWLVNLGKLILRNFFRRFIVHP